MQQRRGRSRVSRASALLGSYVGGLALVIGGCAGATSEPRPVPTLASSAPAAAAFREIREAWKSPDRTDAAALRPLIEGFLERFPDDGLAPMARVLLALVAIEDGDLAVADRELAATERLAAGTARDLGTVARARLLRLRGEPGAALELLAPLVGKNVDPIARSVCEEELSLAALATHRDYEAISYMDAWLRAGAEEDKSRTRAIVRTLVARLPKEVLLGALQAMRSQRALGYGVEIERVLAERLATMATANGDTELARALLDPSAGPIAVAGETAAALGALATSRRGLNTVQGRTIGLLLPTESPGLRDEAADVLRGVMWALGLPRGLRTSTPGADAAPDAGAIALPGGCGPKEQAPPLEDPDSDDALRLVTRDDAALPERTETSLDELAGDGSALIIAGLDPRTAARAVQWGQAHGVAVVVLVPPLQPAALGAFGFVMGESRTRVAEALARAVPSLGTAAVAPIIDTSEVAEYPWAGGQLGPIHVLPPISCDVPATGSGDPRFPIAEWSRDKVQAWLVTGSPACARDVVGELSAARARGVVALSLEAALVPARGPSVRVVTAAAGVVPYDVAHDGGDDELRRFGETLGAVGFWSALGRDAATLARLAVRQLPPDDTADPRAVTDRRTRARDALAAARAPLWSTEKAGWSDDHTMGRTVCTIELSGK